MGWCARALSRQTNKKKKNSRRFYTFQISLSLRFQNAVGLLWPRESLLPKKKRNTSPPAKFCCFDSFFGEGARARFENERERERETESFFCDEREISVHLGS